MTLLLEQLESAILAACSSALESSDLCEQAAREHLRAGGSRVRARICLDAGTRLGLNAADAVTAGAVVELLHNASLVHDDLLDRTPTRRQAPSIWAKQGDAMAVCCGDLMLSAAYSLLGRLSVPAKIAPALALVHQRTREVISGEASEGRERARTEGTICYYERQARGKSASLLSLALELPLLLADQSPFLVSARLAAGDFAVAYQVSDDLADFEADGESNSSNLVSLLMREDGLPQPLAMKRAVQLAAARLASAEKYTQGLPHECAYTLVELASKLSSTLAEPGILPFAVAAG